MLHQSGRPVLMLMYELTLFKSEALPELAGRTLLGLSQD